MRREASSSSIWKLGMQHSMAMPCVQLHPFREVKQGPTRPLRISQCFTVTTNNTATDSCSAAQRRKTHRLL
jgi:hypothetical protein